MVIDPAARREEETRRRAYRKRTMNAYHATERLKSHETDMEPKVLRRNEIFAPFRQRGESVFFSWPLI
jgi:hypothetical protein